MSLRMKEVLSRASRIYLASLLLVAGFISNSSMVVAGEVTDRSVSLSTSEPSASANYTFNFSAPSSTPIQSFAVEVCEEATGVCDVPVGFSAENATLLNQPSGFGDTSGWSIDTNEPDLIRMNNISNTQSPDVNQSVTFGNITNPSTANETFYLRMATFENDDYTGEIDTGVVAVSTAEAITVSGFVPPILTFCVGVEVPGDCATASGSNIDLGTFSPSATASDTSQMRASTNAGDGYVITVEGTTLSSGSNTIPALASPTASQTETSQFGINLRNNTDPNVGSEVSGSGDGNAEPGFDTVDQFMFEGGEIVAQAPGPTDSNTYTVSYITNIAPSQAAGNYSTTLTYVATAMF